MQPQNRKRFERLRRLSPLDAVQAWLDGDFGMGDEDAMIAAIRKDPRITASDDQIIDTIIDAMGEEADAATCLEWLAGLK